MNMVRTCVPVLLPVRLGLRSWVTFLVTGTLDGAATPRPALELPMTVIGLLGRQLIIMCALLAGRKLGLVVVSLQVPMTALKWNVRGARVWKAPGCLGMDPIIPWLFRLLASRTALAEVQVMAVVPNRLRSLT